MARIFNIYFTFDQVVYHAVVSVRTTTFFTEYSLNNINEDLLKSLPGNKIISSSPDHFIFKDAGSQHLSRLMESIITAVKDHVHTSA